MKIKKLTLTNFRNYEFFEINFNEKLNVIVAENGVGKTTILDAIAIGYGAMLTRMPKVKGKSFEEKDFRIAYNNNGQIIRTPFMRILIDTFEQISWGRTQSRDKSAQTKVSIPESKDLKELNAHVDSLIDKDNENDKNFEIPLIMYYGTSRAVLRTPMRKRDFQKEFSRFEALSGALEASTDFHRLFQWFDAMEDVERRQIVKGKQYFDYKLPELEAVRRAIESMLSGFSNPRIEMYPLRLIVDRYLDNKVTQLRIDQLSDGYKTVLAMVMDIAARMAEANPHLDNPLSSGAVIMIDEVDLHLHPRWQQTIIEDLLRTFPNAQFILTTHSPQVLTTVEPENILPIVLEENQPVIKKDFDFSYGARSSEVIKTVLGVDERPQNLEIVQQLNEYLKLINKDEYNSEQARELRNKLNQWGAGKEKDLLRADMDIRVKEYQKTRQ